jgi:cobalt-zinc-cadmium efflux system outer membrane protein
MLKAGRRDVERQLVAQVKTQVALVAGARSALDFAKEVQASAIAVARSQSAVDLAKRERMPDVGWTLSYTQTGTGPNALQPPTLTFGLSLPLPLFYQRQGEISRADADHQGAEWERAKLAAAVRADVQSAWAAFTASRRVVERSQSSLLEKSQKARDITEVQFRAGSASLMDYLDAERAFVQTNIAYRAALVAYWSSVFQLEAAVGSEFLS